MKKTALLNTEISEVIARMGHRDMLVIGDAGLPIPLDVQRIDLALTVGVPTFAQTLRTVLTELKVESIIVAQETQQKSPQIWKSILEAVGELPVKAVPHQEFKEINKQAYAMIRTGEFTPYANVILVAGVVF